MSGLSSYPKEWIENNCPPADSLEPNGDFYRVVERKPPTKDDFLNSVEADKYSNAPICSRWALSMLNTWEGAVHHLKLFPFKADWFIATATLGAAHGRVKPTPSRKQPAHTAWWPFPDVVRESAVTDVRKP